MRIASDLAGFNLGQADLLRRSMGKKKAEIIAAQRASFIKGAVQKGVAENIAQQIFDLMEHFAGYGFNKSHSAAYALIAYQTAYLKAHYPVEYMAALLTSVMEHSDKVTFYIRASLDMGIKILPPDVNESSEVFTAVGDKIRFGLAAVKNVGENAIKAIIQAREAGGPFKSLQDFCERVDLRVINRRMMESLIWCGAFSATNLNRSQLLMILDQSIEVGQQAYEDRISGQLSLFDLEGSLDAHSQILIPNEPEYPKNLLLAKEKETIGYYVSGHPLDDYQDLLAKLPLDKIESLPEKADSSKITIAGIILQLKASITRKGEKMAYLSLEDLTGTVNVLVFPRIYQGFQTILADDALVLIEGRLSLQEDEVKIFAESVKLLASDELQLLSQQQSLYVKVNDSAEGEQLVRDIIAKNPGQTPVYLVYAHRQKIVLLNQDLWVDLGKVLVTELEQKVGKENIYVKSGGRK